jgi:uncharacterized protein DUF4055
MASAQTPSIFPATFGSELSAPSPYVMAARLDWSVVDTLWGGTKSMRLAGRTFLPQEPLEQNEHYERRLNRTTLHNYYKHTILSGVAKIFTKDPHFEPTEAGKVVPTEIDRFKDDVDTQGRNIGQFSKELLADASNHGISFLLVDYPNGPQEFISLAEERAAGNRPYWVKINATQVLDFGTDKFVDGEYLSYFKFMEDVTTPSSVPFLAPTTVKQIRIYKQFPGATADDNSPVLFAIYRSDEDKKDGWKLYDSGVTSTKHIAIYPVYTQKTGFMLGEPPLMDLAEVNIEHWQAKSDYSNILHIANVPIMLLKGFPTPLDKKGNEQRIEVSPNVAMNAPSADADIKWVEHTGKSIESARTNIKDLEARMESLGMVLTTQQHAGVSATANNINSSEANSMLKSFALNLQDALNAAIDATCQFFEIENTTRIVVNTEYAADYTTNETMSDVIDLYKEGVVDAKTTIAEAKRRNVLDNAAIIEPPVEEAEVPSAPTANPQPQGNE